MNKIFFSLLLLLSTAISSQAQPNAGSAAQAQSDYDKSIRQVLATTAEAWNRGDIDEFMTGYWNSDSLVFIGKKGPVYGYQPALANYKKTYDGPDKMGKLTFSDIKVTRLSPDYCFVIGKWFLKRNAGDVGGTYTLLFRKIKGSWKIVVDHTS